MSGSWRSTPLPSNWGVLRSQVLQRDRTCQWGLRGLPGEVDGVPCRAPATECDHMGDPDDHRPEVLRGLCVQHHSRRTSMQKTAFNLARASLRRRPQEPHPAYKPGMAP